MPRLGMCLLGLVFALGCSSNPREGLVTSTVQLLSESATKINSLNDKIEEAKKKKEKEKGWDFKEMNQAADDLAKTGVELQKNYHRVMSLKEPPSPEEKDGYKKQYQTQITEGMKKVDEANRKMSQLLKDLEVDFKKDPTNAEWLKFKDKLSKAQGDFQVMAVRSK